MSNDRAVLDLVEWASEAGCALPLSSSEIVQLEACGVIVELFGGGRFVERVSWSDFTRRWVTEMQRRGEEASVQRLARAVRRACGCGWSPAFCALVADVLLFEVDHARPGYAYRIDAAQIA